jgi:hypothetical protein
MTRPGLYATTLVARLVDFEGEALTEGVSITVQFEVSRWVHVSPDIPEIRMTFRDGDWDVFNVYDATTVRVEGNDAWQLRAAHLGDVVSEEGLTGLPPVTLAVYVPEADLEPGLDAASSGSVGLGSDPVTIVSGYPESPSSGLFTEIPVFVRLDSDQPLPAGRYRMTLVFEASAQGPLP